MSDVFKLYGYLDNIQTDVEGNIYITLNRRTYPSEVLIKTCLYLLRGREVEVTIRRRKRRRVTERVYRRRERRDESA